MVDVFMSEENAAYFIWTESNLRQLFVKFLYSYPDVENYIRFFTFYEITVAGAAADITLWKELALP